MNTGKDFTFVLDQDNIYKDANYHTAEKKKKKIALVKNKSDC